jgi:hypothetical protein
MEKSFVISRFIMCTIHEVISQGDGGGQCQRDVRDSYGVMVENLKEDTSLKAQA